MQSHDSLKGIRIAKEFGSSRPIEKSRYRLQIGPARITRFHILLSGVLHPGVVLRKIGL